MAQDLLYKVAYDEAVRALSEQQAEIDSFRTRGGMLLSAAAVTTSFLGARTLQGSDSSALIWLALLAFGGVGALSLALLWPHKWQVTMDPHVIVKAYIEAEHPAATTALYRELIRTCIPVTCRTGKDSICWQSSFKSRAACWHWRSPSG